VIPHNRPTLGRAEQEAAARVLASGWLAQGAEVEAFEREICHYLGVREGHAVALSSGTAALFSALWALQARGKRVAIPAYSCAALRNAVIMAGGDPMAIDVAHESPNIDLEQAVKSGAEIIIAAHMFGIPLRWHGGAVAVPVIEDCAQAFGARIDNCPVGLRGTVGVFSFYATKMLTSGGQGGMLVSNDGALVEAVRDYRQFDARRDRVPRFNLQMTDLQAAIGRAQLAQIDAFLGMRKVTYARYAAAGLRLWPSTVGGAIEPCNYRAIIRTSHPAAAIDRLERSAIRAIVPIADWELLEDPAKVTRAGALTRSTVSLPLYPSLTQAEIAGIIAAASTLNREVEIRSFHESG
jgi:perosamine synthetase